MQAQPERIIFMLTIFIAGLCSIIYELLISTTSSYFMGDSIKQFSLVIGIYMAAMGLGSYLSKFITKDLLEYFIKIEVLLGLIGGSSIPLLYFAFGKLSGTPYQFVILSLTFLIGVLTGFEIPLLVRILKTHFPLKSNLAYVLGLDYIGALMATLLFPFLLLPFVGTFKTSIIFGAANIFLGVFIYHYFTKKLTLKRKTNLEWIAVGCILYFILMWTFSNKMLSNWEDQFYKHTIIHSEQSPYQKLVLTKNKSDISLYLNRIIQFSSRDEYRYHESLAQLPMHFAPYKKNILILGGGEGLLAREVLKHPQVEKLTIVDLDPAVFKLAKENPYVKAINENALFDKKVNLVSEDALVFLKNTEEKFDIILSDLPDPSNESIARLYSTHFFKMAQSRLTAYGIFATQATSVFHSKNAFWCIHNSIQASHFKHVYPYHAYVPSFGDWGFVMAANYPLEIEHFEQKVPCRYLDSTTANTLFYFEQDLVDPSGLKINHLDRLALLDYYLKDWERWRR